MYITKDKVKEALETQGISPRTEDAKTEFEIMDKDFNNHVRFKDFCKFCKKHAKGKAYEDVDGKDSSLSSSDEFDE